MIELLAFILLVLRLIATHFLIRVLKAQWELMKRPLASHARTLVDEQDIISYRKQLFYLTLALAGSNLLPIIFDLFIMTKGIGIIWFTVTTTEFLIVYTISNALAALLAAVLIYRIYRNALEVDQHHETSDHTLMNNE